MHVSNSQVMCNPLTDNGENLHFSPLNILLEMYEDIKGVNQKNR
jgi:hypothetical protein